MEPLTFNGSQHIRRYREGSEALRIYFYLHTQDGAPYTKIMKDLELTQDQVINALIDLFWGGFININDVWQAFHIPFPLTLPTMLTRYFTLGNQK